MLLKYDQGWGPTGRREPISAAPILFLKWSAVPVTWPCSDMVTLYFLPGSQTTACLERGGRFIWVHLFRRLWGPELSEFDQRFSQSPFCPREGQPALVHSLFWASPEAFRAWPAFSQAAARWNCSELWACGRPGALCPHLQQRLRAVVVAAWAIAAVGEITRPQGECLKLLKKIFLKQEEKSCFLCRPASLLRNSDCIKNPIIPVEKCICFWSLLYVTVLGESALKDSVSYADMIVSVKESVGLSLVWRRQLSLNLEA